MARSGREKSKSGVYHAILRGREGLFFDDMDYGEFLQTAHRYFDNKKTRLYAYSLEPNKIHIVFYCPEINLVMKPLCTSYARYINRKYSKSGRLFFDRFISEPVEDGYLEEVIRFVNTKPNAKTSADEFLKGGEYCAVDFLKKKIKNTTDKALILPCTDTYSDMTDKEIKDYILYINELTDKEFSKLEKSAKLEIAKRALNSSNMSKRRLMRILGISEQNAAPSAKKPKKAEKPLNPPQQKKEELSVWLL